MRLLKKLLVLLFAAISFESFASSNTPKLNLSNSQQPVTIYIYPTRMNMLYIGVNNPVDISVSGVASDKIRCTVTNGRIVKANSVYIINVTKQGKCILSVSIKDGDSYKKIADREFDVKRIPDPIAKIFDITSGNIQKNKLLAAKGIQVNLEDFNFDAKFKVTNFTVTTVINGREVEYSTSGSSFTVEQKNLLKKVRPGQKVYINNIKVKAPDGSIINVSPIVLTIK